MAFLYPYFLLAGLCLAIPVLIHLFNLRRYKTVYFPSTRFLKSVALKSQRQSKLQHKWLLLLRLLFLAALIFAFAQPYLANKGTQTSQNKLQVLYLDNSYSMTRKSGPRTLLDVAKDAAIQFANNAAANTKFLILTNNGPLRYQAMPVEEAVTAISGISTSALSLDNEAVFGQVQSLIQTELADGADLYYFSDFQKSGFSQNLPTDLAKNIKLHGVYVDAPASANLYIDTAFLTTPVLEAGQPAKLVVRTATAGKPTNTSPTLQLTANGQVKSAVSPSFNADGISTDTLEFNTEGNSWQRLQLTLNDGTIPFDDTFRIAARSAANLSVLVLNEGQQSPYINAAFRAYSGFTLSQHSTADVPKDWRPYNLIVYNGITALSAAEGEVIAQALRLGKVVCIFPGFSKNPDRLNEGLQVAANVRVLKLDTSTQTATTLQSGSDLVKDIFERIPENLALPTANWHLALSAPLQANGQSIISFRNGDPLLVQYSPTSGGKLYVSSVSADASAGNFSSSYFFVPFLYQMALHSSGTGVYALTSGMGQAAYLPLRSLGDRQMLHLIGNGVDAIPPQQTAGGGVNVFVDAAVQEPGFYRLTDGGADSAVVALNANRKESQLESWAMADLKKDWSGKDAEWISPQALIDGDSQASGKPFPWWRLAVAIALLWLLVESILLGRPVFRKAASL